MAIFNNGVRGLPLVSTYGVGQGGSESTLTVKKKMMTKDSNGHQLISYELRGGHNGEERPGQYPEQLPCGVCQCLRPG